MGPGTVGNLQGPQNNGRETAPWSQLDAISTHQVPSITQPPGGGGARRAQGNLQGGVSAPSGSRHVAGHREQG